MPFTVDSETSGTATFAGEPISQFPPSGFISTQMNQLHIESNYSSFTHSSSMHAWNALDSPWKNGPWNDAIPQSHSHNSTTKFKSPIRESLDSRIQHLFHRQGIGNTFLNDLSEMPGLSPAVADARTAAPARPTPFSLNPPGFPLISLRQNLPSVPSSAPASAPLPMISNSSNRHTFKQAVSLEKEAILGTPPSPFVSASDFIKWDKITKSIDNPIEMSDGELEDDCDNSRASYLRGVNGDCNRTPTKIDVSSGRHSHHSHSQHHPHHRLHRGRSRTDDLDDAEDEDDRMSLSSLSSGEKVLLSTDTSNHHSRHHAASTYQNYPPTSFMADAYLPDSNRFQFTQSFQRTFSMGGHPVEPNRPLDMKKVKLQRFQPLKQAVIELVAAELRSIIQKDVNKKMIENTAYKIYEGWWDENERLSKSKKEFKENAKQPIATSVTKSQINTVSPIDKHYRHREESSKWPSVLSSVTYNKNRTDNPFSTAPEGYQFGGLRAAIPKMPSFRRKIKPVSPRRDRKNTTNRLNSQVYSEDEFEKISSGEDSFDDKTLVKKKNRSAAIIDDQANALSSSDDDSSLSSFDSFKYRQRRKKSLSSVSSSSYSSQESSSESSLSVSGRSSSASDDDDRSSDDSNQSQASSLSLKSAESIGGVLGKSKAAKSPARSMSISSISSRSSISSKSFESYDSDASDQVATRKTKASLQPPAFASDFSDDDQFSDADFDLDKTKSATKTKKNAGRKDDESILNGDLMAVPFEKENVKPAKEDAADLISREEIEASEALMALSGFSAFAEPKTIAATAAPASSSTSGTSATSGSSANNLRLPKPVIILSGRTESAAVRLPSDGPDTDSASESEMMEVEETPQESVAIDHSYCLPGSLAKRRPPTCLEDVEEQLQSYYDRRSSQPSDVVSSGNVPSEPSKMTHLRPTISDHLYSKSQAHAGAGTKERGSKKSKNKENQAAVPNEPVATLAATAAEIRKLKKANKAKVKLETNLLLPDVIPEPKVVPKPLEFNVRSETDELRILYDFIENGVDSEDMKYLKRSYEALLQEENVTYNWLNESHWSDHPVTRYGIIPANKRRRKAADEQRIHVTGCARTEGYYKISDNEKARHAQMLHGGGPTIQVEEAEKGASLRARTTVATTQQATREARSNQRRLLATVDVAWSDLLKFNQLQFRKKQLKFARSRIHDWGLFALEPIAADEMVIEYVGQMIRPVVADLRERKYNEMGIGSSYLFRVDLETIIDATRVGNLARFINHSCNVSCNAEFF